MKIFTKIIICITLFFFLNIQKIYAEEKIKIGLLVPLSGENSEIGKSIIKSVRLAINKIDSSLLEIIPKDTESSPQITLKHAKELGDSGIKIIIGPVFNKNLIYLDELKDIIFLSLTNKIIDNPKNIISAGINASSQLNTIVKFIETNDLKKTIFLIPDEKYKEEIKKGISKSKIKINKIYYYDTKPTKLTKQIEKITKYEQRKQNLKDEIKRIENSDENNKEKKIENLEKKDTIGKIDFDSIIIADFDQNLKSITTSLLYTDVLPKNISFITLNQWFDESLLKEKTIQPIYFPSINKNNYDDFVKNYYETFDEYPNQLSFLSYDLIGLVYYLIAQNNFIIDQKIFIKKNKFKGKIGIFEIKGNKINHILNFYKVNDGEFKKIF
ncbi:MAG: ABC-type branched-chain amino acid transport system, substrate-binding protein [Pelagibacterales bacterium]|nr:ABC-type branched-chain amino acid transport system, substrate-binding protein [Pelagibacterales bacterium]